MNQMIEANKESGSNKFNAVFGHSQEHKDRIGSGICRIIAANHERTGITEVDLKNIELLVDQQYLELYLNSIYKMQILAEIIYDCNILHKQVANGEVGKLQKFFEEDEIALARGEPSKPIFFSKTFKLPVLSINSFINVLNNIVKNSGNLENLQNRIDFYLTNRAEFILHEYGHIAENNGLIVSNSQDQEASLLELRAQIIREFRFSPAEKKLLKHCESDLLAEVYRFSIQPFDPREPKYFAKLGFLQRISPLGSLTPKVFDCEATLKNAVWLPIFKAYEDFELYDRTRSIIATRISESKLVNEKLAEMLTNYFCLFFDNKKAINP